MKKKENGNTKEQSAILEQEVLALSAQEAKVMAARLEKENTLERLRRSCAGEYVGKHYQSKKSNQDMEYLNIISMDENFVFLVERFGIRSSSGNSLLQKSNRIYTDSYFERIQMYGSNISFSAFVSEISGERYKAAKMEFLERLGLVW